MKSIFQIQIQQQQQINSQFKPIELTLNINMNKELATQEAEHESLNDRNELSDGETSSPQSLRLEQAGSSPEKDDEPGSLARWGGGLKDATAQSTTANQYTRPGSREGVQTVRYAHLDQRLQVSAPEPQPRSQGRSPQSLSASAAVSSARGASQHPPTTPTGDHADQTAAGGTSENSNPVQPFQVASAVRQTPLAYDLCDITEEDHSAQMSQSSRFLGQQNPYGAPNNHTQSSLDHQDQVVLFDKSQSSQMNALNGAGELLTRNANMPQRHSGTSLIHSQQKGETDSSLYMDKSFPSSDQQVQLQRFMGNSGMNYHQTLPYPGQRSSLHSTPVMAATAAGAQLARPSQTKETSPSVEDFGKVSPILAGPNYQNEVFRSSFRSPKPHTNPFNTHAEYSRGFPTEYRNTYGSGGQSLDYTRQMTGGSAGPDEDVIQASKSVNSAQFHDLLKEHRNFMSAQPELAEGYNRQVSQRAVKKNAPFARAAGSGTLPLVRRSVQGRNSNNPEGKPQSDEDLLSHMSRLSQLVPSHDQLENADSQGGSQVGKNVSLRVPTQRQMLEHFRLMEQKLNDLEGQVRAKDEEVENLKNHNETLQVKLSAENVTVKVLQSQRGLKAGSGRFTGRQALRSAKGSELGPLNSEGRQMVDDFDSAFSNSNRNGLKQGASKNSGDLPQKQNQQQTQAGKPEALDQLVTEGSDNSHKMEFQAKESEEEDEILAIKKELSSHAHQSSIHSIPTPPAVSEGRPSITHVNNSAILNNTHDGAGSSINSNTHSQKLFTFLGDGEKHSQQTNQREAGLIGGYGRAQSPQTEEEPEWASGAQKNNRTAKMDGLAARSLGSSHKKLKKQNQDAVGSGNRIANRFHTQVQNQSDSSFEKDFGELRAGNLDQRILEGNNSSKAACSNQGEARAKALPLVPEYQLFSENSSIEKKERQDIRLKRDNGLERRRANPNGKKGEMLEQKLFEDDDAWWSLAGSEQQEKIKDGDKLVVGQGLFTANSNTKKNMKQLPRIARKQNIDGSDQGEAEKEENAKFNSQLSQMLSPENKEFTLGEIRALPVCSPEKGSQKYSLSVPNSHQVTAEKRPQPRTRNVGSASHTSSVGGQAKRDKKRGTVGQFGAKDRQRLTKQSSLGTDSGQNSNQKSQGKNFEHGQSLQNISRSLADNSEADQSLVEPSKANTASERVKQLQQKAALMKSQIQSQESDNFALREKITNIKKLYHKKQEQVQELELRQSQSRKEQEELKEALEEKQNIIDSHQVEIEELKKQNLQAARGRPSQIDIRNKETQIYIREFTKDQGCQVDTLRPPSQTQHAPQLIGGPMPPMLNPYLLPPMPVVPLANPVPEPQLLNFTAVTEILDQMIMKDDFDLNFELKTEKEEIIQTRKEGQPETIEELVKQCQKYEAAQRKLQMEIQQDQQQMARAAMHQSMMAMSLPSQYQSIYPNRAQEQLDIKTDQNILLEKANTQLQGKLMQQKEKYDNMKRKLILEIQERDQRIAQLRVAHGSRRTPQMASLRKKNGGQRTQEAKSQSPSAAYTIQDFDHFNSLISHQLGKYQSSHSQTGPQVDTTQAQFNTHNNTQINTSNPLQQLGDAGSQGDTSSQNFQGNANLQYRSMLEHQRLQAKAGESDGLAEHYGAADVQQSFEYDQEKQQEMNSQITAYNGAEEATDERYCIREQNLPKHEQPAHSGYFCQQPSVGQELYAQNDAYVGLEDEKHHGKGAIGQSSRQMPMQTESTPIVKYSQDGSKMSGPMKHPVTISKWLIPANGYTLNSQYANSAGNANEPWLQQTQSVVAAAYMQEIPQHSQSQLKMVADGSEEAERSSHQTLSKQPKEKTKARRVKYYRREAPQAILEKTRSQKGVLYLGNDPRKGRSVRVRRNEGRTKSWSNQNSGLININIRRQHNSGSKPRVARIIPTSSSPAKTAESRRDQPEGALGQVDTQLTENSAEEQVQNAEHGLVDQMPNVGEEVAHQEALDNCKRQERSRYLASQREETDESGVLSEPKDQDITLRVHAKRRQRLNGDKAQPINKSFSPSKHEARRRQEAAAILEPQLKESACSWYIPSLQRVVPLATSKRANAKVPSRTRNTRRPNAKHVLSFGERQEFEQVQGEDGYAHLNLDIRTSENKTVASRSNTNGLPENASSPEHPPEMLVQDQAMPQPNAEADSSELQGAVQDQCAATIFQPSSAAATAIYEPQLQQSCKGSLPSASPAPPQPVGSSNSTPGASALRQLIHNQRTKTEESQRSEFPSARPLEPMVTTKPGAKVSDAWLDGEFDQTKEKEQQQQLQQQAQKRAAKAAHLQNIMAQLQRLKDQQASVDRLTQEELNLASQTGSAAQQERLNEIRKKYSAPV